MEMITKPFAVEALATRIRAMIKRGVTDQGDGLKVSISHLSEIALIYPERQEMARGRRKPNFRTS
jgi:DNA-binding response OmpR family regulator